MALVELFTSINMLTGSTWYGQVTEYSSSKVVISDGFYKNIYYGNGITYSGSRVVGGTFTGFESYAGNQLNYRSSGSNLPAVDMYSYFSVSNFEGMKQYVLSGSDTIKGSSENDTITGYTGNDSLYGNAGNDILYGNSGSNLLDGGEGNDTFFRMADNDTLNGGNGIDTINYQNDYAVTVSLALTDLQPIQTGTIQKLTNIENIIGSNYRDMLNGNTADNYLIGNSGDDVLFGASGNDSLFGSDGNDGLRGSDGNDYLDGGSGIDWGQYWSAPKGLNIDLNKTNAQDTSGAGIDTLINIENLNGSAFNDNFTGNAPANKLLGNEGNDTLVGAYGNDTLTGGAGKDIFIFNKALNNNYNVDKITDFTPADDTITLNNDIFKKLTQTGVLNNQSFEIGPKSSDANDYLIYSPNTGTLAYDSDGNGNAPAIKIATLGLHLSITNADFVVV